MRGKLNIKGMSFEDFDIIIGDRFFRHIKNLKLENDKMPDYMMEFAQTNFQSGFLDCISYLREKGIIKVKGEAKEKSLKDYAGDIV